MRRIYLHCWGMASANAICLKTGAGSTFAASGWTHGLNAIVNTSVAGYLDTKITPALAGMSETNSSFVALVLAPPSPANYSWMGTCESNAALGYNSLGGTTNNISLILTNSNRTVLSCNIGEQTGVIIGSREGTTNFVHRTRMGVLQVLASQTQATLSEAVSNTLNMWIGMCNFNNSGYAPSLGTFGATGFGLALTQAESQLIGPALETLWSGVSGVNIYTWNV